MPNKRRKFILTLFIVTAVSLYSYGCSREPEEEGAEEQPGAVQVEETYDFSDKLGGAEIITSSADYVRVAKARFVVNNDKRRVLFEHPNSEVVFKDVPVSKGTGLEFGIGINQNAWDKPGDGVLFEVNVVDERSEEYVIFSRYIDPKNNAGDRKWFDNNIDLKAFAGQKVSFIFKTTGGPKGDTKYDWAAWSKPRLVMYDRIFSAEKPRTNVIISSDGQKAEKLVGSVDFKRKCPPECNVILVLIDTLRADHLGSYGYERDTSPHIDAFAKKSVLFENVTSQAACTFPSVNSILTSKYPFSFLGQPDNRFGIPDHIKSLAEILKDKNYSTAAISASPIVRKTPSHHNKFGGYDRGFDFFDDECEWEEASCINDKTFKILNHIKSPFFLYLHYIDVHGPYSPPKEFMKKFSKDYKGKEFVKDGNPNPIEKMLYSNGPDVNLTEEDIRHLIDLYDDEIAYFDSQFKVLLDEISEKGLTDSTIIIIASDHGEEFMEHNSIKHCHTLFDTEIKVPLIIRIPSIDGAVRSVKVQNLDIVPTTLDYLNFSLNGHSFDGKSLRPVIESNRDVNENVFSAQSTLRSIRDDRYKLIHDISSKAFSLYDLKTDEGETENVVSTKTDVFERLKEKLFEWLYTSERGTTTSNQIEDAKEIEKQLKALGYLQ